MLTMALKATEEYRRLLQALARQECPAALFGLPPAARALTFAALYEDTGRPMVVLCAGDAQATRLAQDLQALGVPSGVFPARDLVFHDIEGQNHEYEYRRLQALGDVVGGRTKVLCAGVAGALQYTLPREELLRCTLTVRAGQTLPPAQLVQRLLEAGYVRRDLVEGPGQFSARGGIVDVYAPDMPSPARLEYWGDTVESLHAFDVMSQRRDAALKKIYLSPAREVLLGSPEQALAFLQEAIRAQKGAAGRQLATAAAGEMERLRAGVLPASMDKFLPLRYAQPATVLDYFDDALLVLEEPGALREAQNAAAWQRQQQVKAGLEQGILCGRLTAYGEDWTALVRRAQAGSTLLCDLFTRSLPDFSLRTLINATGHSLPAWGSTVAVLADDLRPLLAQGYACAVMAGTPKAAAGLLQDLAALHLPAQPAGKAPPAAGCVAVMSGHMESGVELPFARFALFTARTQEAARPLRPRKRRQGSLSSLEELAPGDYVVHQSHGIGRYAGIQRLDIHGVVKDYLKIAYEGSDWLYVPVTQLDLLSRYDAAEDAPVRLAKLGGSEWSRTKSRTKAAARQIADELVQLYARRQAAQGFAFAPDSEWQRDFETRFEYDETPDQLQAIQEIKRDMERPHPMDRLLCGDVGVGKTEVALRAVFKCVMSGKQAAILVPTTILAWQHYQTILRRMEAFPIKVGLLSRFAGAAAQRQTLRDLAGGVCDVVVGTHRLLQKDVSFHDLGLLVVDEEQRFGVHHKEKLRERFVGVDTLTLSATPIPRTLNMAMNGIRDMSSMQQPPVERLPVETYVLEYDPAVVVQAIRRELDRGGQVYYLHNRIDSIDACAARLAQALPGARIGIGHGRMEDDELSGVWRQLLEGELDILVCTTIIEAGVDVRNCNTLIVEDADRLGLAQLYQIRGRVGRSGRKAYAYFTFRRDKSLSEISLKRLGAIREFTAFGSGLRIAMRDMQIRGVGSLLGASQHGHIQAVGYELYTRLLARAMAEAKGESLPPDKSTCTVDIAADAYIPQEYIPHTAGRIEAYKRIAAIEDTAGMEDVLAELADRYGPLPNCVRGLVQVSFARVGAAALGITDITQKGQELLFYSDRLDRALLGRLLPALAHRAMVCTAGRPYLAVALAEGEAPLEALGETLRCWQQAAADAAAGAAEAGGAPAGVPAAPAQRGAAVRTADRAAAAHTAAPQGRLAQTTARRTGAASAQNSADHTGAAPAQKSGGRAADPTRPAHVVRATHRRGGGR